MATFIGKKFIAVCLETELSRAADKAGGNPAVPTPKPAFSAPKQLRGRIRVPFPVPSVRLS
jgi:hypothetical protein